MICLFLDGEIKELWPLELINNKLRFINDKHADFCDILSETDSFLIVEYLSKENRIGRFRLKNLIKESKVATKLKKVAYSNINFSLNFSTLSLLISDSFPSNFTHFIYKQKRRLKRILNKFSVEHLLFDSKSKVFPKKEILVLKNIMIAKSIRNHGFLDMHFLLLAEQLYDSGFLIVSIIKVDDKISGISLIFKHEDQYSFWVDLFDDRKMINLYHNTLFLKYITQNSDAVFNFGRGIYNYKIQNYQPEVYELFELNTFENIFQQILFQIFQITSKGCRKIYKKIKA